MGIIVGLTGGTGCGKSSVAAVFKEKGYEIIDFDIISRQVSEKGSKCLEEIRLEFGDEILNPDGSLNRKALGAVVFSDSEKLGILNSITHKYILLKSEELVSSSANTKFVFDAPLLFEAGLEKKCDTVVCVISDIQKRAERICKRDGIDYEYALKRINSQKNDEFYIEKSQYIIYNNNSVENLKSDTLEIIGKIEAAAQQ